MCLTALPGDTLKMLANGPNQQTWWSETTKSNPRKSQVFNQLKNSLQLASIHCPPA
ncbi:hypothetical protein JIR001_18980 [Polycladomyces abyssicola]|uniref:Uncharacterized protein n=1 Tax=Polycladomyces abyssicola TaxID=1125966 RepID=A0A8D5UF90_9BACL|nr:hypothetical protein JIR001_18980 [Polycladomyces abyssicola]